jgi:hypothetical protein
VKQPFPSFSTEEGMQINESDEQEENADSPIEESLEQYSNVTIERELHSLKHQLPSILTDEGIQIDPSNGHEENADAAIDKSLEPDSNVTVKRELHRQKQLLPSILTEEGMQISVVIPGCAFLASSRPKSRTSTRTPRTETKFRGKRHLDDPGDGRNAVLPSDVYERFSRSIEINSAPESSLAHAGPAEDASDRERAIATLSAN